MSPNFRLNEISVVEFGVCLESNEGEVYYLIPIDRGVKGALKEMLKNTIDALDLQGPEIEPYEASQKYGAMERLKLPIDDQMLEKVRQIYSSENIETNAGKIRDIHEIVYYFGIFRDSKNNKLLAVRRAGSFKGVIKAKNRLMQIMDETLKIVEDDIFKLDMEFDYIVFNQMAYILRPSGFEYTAAIDTYILQKAKESALHIARVMPFLDLASLAEYVATHKRAARLIASIRSRRDINRTSRQKLTHECEKFGIELIRENTKWRPAEGHETEFLKLLDRRLYSSSLTDEEDELYEAANRKEIKPPLEGH